MIVRDCRWLLAGILNMPCLLDKSNRNHRILDDPSHQEGFGSEVKHHQPWIKLGEDPHETKRNLDLFHADYREVRK